MIMMLRSRKSRFKLRRDGVSRLSELVFIRRLLYVAINKLHCDNLSHYSIADEAI